MLPLLLLLLLCAPLGVAPVFNDLDAQQPHSIDGGRWRCQSSDLSEAMIQARMTNYTGLGWLDEFLAPVASNLTGCEELYLPGLHGAHEWLAPLAAGQAEWLM